MKVTTEIKYIKTLNYHLQLFIDHFNERLRIDNYRGNMTMICKEIERIAEKYSLSKVIFYTRPEHWQQLLSNGYELEAIMKGYFNGTDNYIMTCYKNNERRTSQFWIKEDSILQTISNQPKHNEDIPASSENFFIRKATVKDSQKLAELYSTIFEVYPTPMNKIEYVKKMFEDGVIFYVIECDKEIVSAASADINLTLHHAELTDCATIPKHRKYGLMKKLLIQLEADLKSNGIFTAFSIARALSFGMNKAFYQLDYQYMGRLTNNCYIFDKLEDMNVWVKDLTLS